MLRARDAMDRTFAEPLCIPRLARIVAIGFTTSDCRKTYQELLAKGVEFTQEPVEQPYGIDVGLRDPFGNHIRIAQLKAQSR
jgi:uncharacterized glyoxalase superfamily protein PhnB